MEIDNNEKQEALLHYLNYEVNQKNKGNEEKNVSKFVEEITQSIDADYRVAVFIILKTVILENFYNKSIILKKLEEMYKQEEIERLKKLSLLNKQILKGFENLDNEQRKTVIYEIIKELENKEFEISNNKSSKIDDKIIQTIKNEKSICVEYKYSEKDNRLLYIFENGTIIALDIKNKNTITSSITYVKKEVIEFINKFIQIDFEKQQLEFNTNIITMKNEVWGCDESIFYLILLLVTQKGKLDNKLFFKYEEYFRTEFYIEVRSLKEHERKEKFIFANWCPNENEYKQIINRCNEIINELNIDIKAANLLELKYFSDYYMEKQKHKKSLQFYEELVKRGVDFANKGIANYYRAEGNEELARKYEEKAKTTFMSIYKNITDRKCYKLNINDNVIPEILDSKINGNPYLPIGEKYPVNEKGKPLSLVIQINFESIELEDYPQKGVLQIFADVTDMRESKYEIRYYEDVTCKYQTEFPQVQPIHFFGLNKSAKLDIEEHNTWMPTLNYKFKTELKKSIKLYNEKIGVKLYNNENDMEGFIDLINQEKQYPLLVGGYSDYADFITSDGSECEKRKKDCLIKLVDNDTSSCLNIVISRSDLINKEFNKAEIFYMD